MLWAWGTYVDFYNKVVYSFPQLWAFLNLVAPTHLSHLSSLQIQVCVYLFNVLLQNIGEQTTENGQGDNEDGKG